MQGTTRGWAKRSDWLLQSLAVVALLGLALLGHAPGEVIGWVLPVGGQRRGAYARARCGRGAAGYGRRS